MSWFITYVIQVFSKIFTKNDQLASNMAPSNEGFMDPEGGIVHISEGLIKQNKKSCSFAIFNY